MSDEKKKPYGESYDWQRFTHEGGVIDQAMKLGAVILKPPKETGFGERSR